MRAPAMIMGPTVIPSLAPAAEVLHAAGTPGHVRFRRRRRQAAAVATPFPRPAALVARAGAIALSIFAASVACGAGAVALFRDVPHAEVLNWTASPVAAQRAGASPVKVGAGKAVRLAAPGSGGTRGAVHVEMERLIDGARCWATVNPGERVIVIARHGRIDCDTIQGALAAVSEEDLRASYRDTLRIAD